MTNSHNSKTGTRIVQRSGRPKHARDTEKDQPMTATLVLEDGTVLSGPGLGTAGEIHGEIVFNTSMSGYEEAFTDPSYSGQILMMTYPLIGNYGFFRKCRESGGPRIRGLVLKHPLLDNRRGKEFRNFLEEAGIPCLHGVDTRELTIRIRKRGTMKAVLSSYPEADPSELLRKIREAPHPDSENLVGTVSCSGIIFHNPDSGKKIVVLDCGVKKSIIDHLKRHGQVIQVPFDTPPERIEALQPSGIVVSNGPGDPAHPAVAAAAGRTVKALIGRYPIFGICLGHQILGLALGFESYKLKFGHRGANHGVKNATDGRICITSQNHGYALRSNPSVRDVAVEWTNVNDGTVEGLRHKTLPVFSVQFHPEGGPGPHDTAYLFKKFCDMLS